MRRAPLLLAVIAAGCSRPQPPLEILGQVHGFTLTAQTGSAFESTKELKGRVWVANFIFTNCAGPCPRMSSQMRQVQNAVKDLPDVRLVSFTVDPERDTPEVLAAYARRQHADERWAFLTGPLEELHRLGRDAFKLGDVDGSLAHSTRFVLLDGQSRIRAYYDTSEPDSIPRLIGDIRRLRKEG